MWRIAWLLLLAFNVSAEPFATSQIVDARATHCDYEDTTTGEAARVPVVVDAARGAAPDFRVCKFDVAHWLPGSVHTARMRSYADGFDPSEWTAATLDRPAAATVTLALVGSAAPPPPPPPDPPAHMASDPFAGSGVLTTPWVDYIPASFWELTQGSGVVAPNGTSESMGCYYGGAASGNNQFSEITITGSLGSAQTYWTASVRVTGAGGTRNLYQATVTSNAYYITKVVAGTGTDVASGAITVNGSGTPVVIRLESEDSGANVVLRAYKDGVQFATYTDTSSVLTGGQPGLEVYAASGSFLTPVTLWSGGDLAGGGSTYNESVSETATASESTSTTATRAGAVAEAGSAADANAATMVRAGALTEAGSASDAPVGVVVISRAVSEAASAADAATGLVTASRAVSEAASAADSQAATMIRAGAVTEAASAADAAAAALQAPVSVSEAATAGDAVSTGAATYEVTMSEAASAADAVSNIATRVASMSEALAAADALSVTAVYGASLAEPASATDATNWGGAVYSTAIAEAGSLQDAVAAALQALAAMSEAGSANDAPTVIISAGVSVVEPAGAAEALAAALQITALLAEPASAADTVFVQPDGTIDVGIEEAAIAMDEYVAVLIDGFLVITVPPRRTLTAGGSRPANLSAAYRPRNLPGRGR